MTTIKLVAHDQRLMLLSFATVASGDRSSVQVTLKANNCWDGYTITVSFWREGEQDLVRDVPLESGGSCLVPPDMLTRPCTLIIGIWGKDADGRYKTSSTVRYRIRRGTPIEAGTEPIHVGSATATPDMVLRGKTFYAGTPNKQVGTIETYEDGSLIDIPYGDIAGRLDKINGEVI